MKEIEKKYLYTGNLDLENCPNAVIILQGYIAANEETEIRIRLYPDTKTSILCLKHKNKLDRLERDEYESTIDWVVGSELYKYCKYSVEKLRLSFTDFKDGHEIHIDIDKFPDGLITVEVELPFKDFIYVPDYCGKEISGQYEYTNYKYAGIPKTNNL